MIKKQSIISCILILFCAYACNSGRVKDFIPGTYVNSARSEFSQANDTLVVVHEQSNSYHIQRRTGFNLVRKGRLMKKQYAKEEWKAIYDLDTNTLIETRKGKVITFYPESACLRVGTRKYIKQ